MTCSRRRTEPQTLEGRRRTSGGGTPWAGRGTSRNWRSLTTGGSRAAWTRRPSCPPWIASSPDVPLRTSPSGTGSRGSGAEAPIRASRWRPKPSLRIQTCRTLLRKDLLLLPLKSTSTAAGCKAKTKRASGRTLTRTNCLEHKSSAHGSTSICETTSVELLSFWMNECVLKCTNVGYFSEGYCTIFFLQKYTLCIYCTYLCIGWLLLE